MRRLCIESLERRILLSADSAFTTGGPFGLTVDPDDYDLGSLLVRFSETGESHGEEVVEGARLGPESSLVNGLRRIELPEQVSVEAALQAYRANPNVIYAEPDYRVRITATPTDPLYSELWGLNNIGQSGGTPDADIDAPEAWDVSTGSGNTVVAVIDTGVDYTHEDLSQNMWINGGEFDGLPGVDDDGNGYVDDIYGYDFANHDGDPMDDHGHGTHVAGTVGAVGDNGIGVAGVNWNVRIMAVKFLEADGTGTTSAAVEAINYAVSQGATISNNSWGGNEPFSQALYDAIAAAGDADHVFVAGAGNGLFGIIPLNNDDIPFYPASYNLDNILAVAATDHNNQLAGFSNYGATSVDLAAPGVDILSTTPNNSYGTMSGTSMATPHVAGVVALVRDLYPDLTYTEVIDSVLGSVVPNPVLAGKTVTGGELNAADALPATQQEIQVLVDGLQIASGGTADFGSASIGTPVTRTVTIRNAGLHDLVLDDLISVPAGFTVISPLSRTTLSFTETATLELQLDAQTFGHFGGEVLIVNNDADENPFRLNVVGNVLQIIDNGDADFSLTGAWSPWWNEGYQNDIHYNAAGTGADLATWTFAVPAGEYSVAATWHAKSNRATDAPYTIFDGDVALGSVRVNQELTPNDLSDLGVGWESLGTFPVTSGTLKVELSDDANEYVIADAVRIERIGDVASAPEVQVLLGETNLEDGVSSVDFGSTSREVPVSKTFTVRNVGTEDLTLEIPISVPHGFSVASSFGATAVGPGESTTFAVQFDAGAEGTFSGEISFGTNDADENPFSFGVVAVTSTVQIIDNGDADFSLTGA
ncbi:MAG: S8 family serine peptidase, partial [Planctomycetota bacterium]